MHLENVCILLEYIFLFLFNRLHIWWTEHHTCVMKWGYGPIASGLKHSLC
jgi:hypothetical protein